MKYKIAYIDEDDSWINIVYQAMKNDFDVARIKIDSESSVEKIITNLLEIELDAIITDYMFEEEEDVSFNGNRIVEEIRKLKPHFPIIMLTSYQLQAIYQMDDVHIIYEKSILEDELDIFMTKIKSNISAYYSKIEKTQNRIEELIAKQNEKGLELPEEEELTKLFMLMDELEPGGKELPANLIHHNSITKLNDFVAQTKELLEELKKGNK